MEQLNEFTYQALKSKISTSKAKPLWELCNDLANEYNEYNDQHHLYSIRAYHHAVRRLSNISKMTVKQPPAGTTHIQFLLNQLF